MEIINDAQVEPRRLLVILQLIDHLHAPTRQDIMKLVQPPALQESYALKNPASASKTSYTASENVLKIAEDCGLIRENDDKTLALAVNPEDIATMPAFQQCMRRILLGVTEAQKSNYLFNLFSAWYVVQNERVLYVLPTIGYDVAFNTDMASYMEGLSERLFNSTKFNGWRKWAEFLGLGWMMRVGNREIIVPDATTRVQSVLPEIFQDQRLLSAELFVERLARLCPELDEGVLFNYCWQVSRGAEQRSHQFSLMLSTALRTLAGLKYIQLIDEGDSLHPWLLHPDPYQQVTHIQWQGVK
jgi:hypothetical protein